MTLSLTDAVNILLRGKNNDQKNELQSVIHEDMNFRRNSVNLLIGRRGSGKTYNVFREISKLGLLDNDSYSSIIYATDKEDWEATVLKFEDTITLPIQRVKYSAMEEALEEHIAAKVRYDRVRNQGREKKLRPDEREDILSSLGLEDFSLNKPHTIVIYDDAMNVFRKPDGYLFKMLLQNRQPRITYFLCIQDPKGIDPSVKSNLDSLWMFGGFNKLKFNHIMSQTTSPMDTDEVWINYKELTVNQAVIFEQTEKGTNIRVIEN